MQKARSHPEGLLQLVSVWFQVLFHSPVWGSFHLSFTVLVHYRSLRSIQPYQMVLADSDRISHVPPYSGYCQVIILFCLQGYHLLWLTFPGNSAIKLSSTLQSYNPQKAQTFWVWAIPLSLAATKGITIVFFSTGYLDVSVLRVCAKLPIFNREGCPIRKSTGYGLFAPNRGLSQLITSFIASESQGIRHTLLLTFLLFSTKNSASYRFFFQDVKERFNTYIRICIGIVENIGFEPMTPSLQSQCSSQLS